MTTPTRLIALVSLAASTLLAGCGLGTAADAGNGSGLPAQNQPVTITGHAHGGPEPISGATVNLYATKSLTSGNYSTVNGVYIPTTPLVPIASGTTSDGSGGTGNTLPAGSFSLTVATPCSAPDYMYITLSGGNPGGGATNSNILLMALVGACTGSATTYQTDVDEATTIAAAYALSGFTSISAGNTVSVVSSATNYMTVSAVSPFSAAGLGHAILNAQNLANANLSVNTQGTSPGQANTTITALGTNQTSSMPAVVPAAEINSLSNALETCVNSAGGSATVGATSASFSTPTTPTSSAGATATVGPLTGSDTLGGFFSLSLAGGTATTFSVPFHTSLATLASTINNTSALSTEGVSAAVAGGILTVTGPVGSTKTLSFTGSVFSQDTDDGSLCGALFANTTPAGGTVPANTLQAALNLTKNPYINAGAVYAIYNLASAQPGYGPSLTAAPKDWTVSVVYQPLFTNGAASGLSTYPLYLTIDASDTIYAIVANGNTPATTASLYSIASNGTLNYATGASSGTCPGSTCTINDSTTAAIGKPAANLYTIAADGLGNLWMPLFTQSASLTPVIQLSASTGAIIASYNNMQQSAKGVAVDRSNNIWWGRGQVTNNQLTEFVYGGSSEGAIGEGNGSSSTAGVTISCTTACGIPYGPYTSGDSFVGNGYGFGGTSGAYGMAIDPQQNIWYAGNNNTGTSLVVLPNQGTVGSPNYVGSYTGLISSGNSSTNATTNPSYISVTITGTVPYGVAIDAAGNAWTVPDTAPFSLQKIVPTLNGSGVITALTDSASYSTGAGFSSPRFLEVDGGGTIWIADENDHGVISFNTSKAAFVSESGGYQPCLVVGGICAANGSSGGANSAAQGARQVMVDSTGSLWIPTGGSSNTGFSNIVQVIGSAAPTWWPGATNPGVMP